MNSTVSGSGPDVVLLHGVPGCAASWAHVAAHLAASHRVVVPDLVGFGASPGAEDLWVEAQAAALSAALDDLGVRGAVVAGHDFGAPVALELARREPERVNALLLAATNVFGDTPIPFPLRAVTWPLVGAAARLAIFSRPSLAVMLRQGAGHGPRPDARAAIGHAGQHRAIRTIFGDALCNLRERYAPVEEALRGFGGPVSVVWGDRDPFFPVEQAHRTAALAQDAQEPLILAGAGHFLPEERPAELADAIAALTARLREPAAV